MPRPLRAQVQRGQRGFQVTTDLSADFMRWSVSTGEMLGYMAEIAKDIINVRTDKGIDVDGKRFTPYKTAWRLRKDENGLTLRDEKGRWLTEEYHPRGDLVTLRSMEDVPEHMRMRASVDVYPRFIPRNARSVLIKPMGGRSGVSHLLRAETAQGTVTRTRGGPDVARIRRIFIGVSNAEWAGILAGIRRDGVLAYARHHRNITALRDVTKAIAAQRRARKKSRFNAERTARQARAENKRQRMRLERLGIEVGEDARAAYQRRQTERRGKRRQKRLDRAAAKRR